jgi:Raf kinase inhibitor-like YbhB/YbcL family protein
MEQAKYFLFLSVLTATGAIFLIINNYTVPHNQPASGKNQNASKLTNNPNNMNLASPAFKNNGNIPKKYTCDGNGINPPLAIYDVPIDTLSLVLIVDDPDAPMAGGFVHWVVFNIDPKTKEIGENSKPAGAIESTNSSGKTGYVGPCPPSGIHHYQFKLYALDEKLRLDKSAKRKDVLLAIAGHILDQALLVGLYQRQ